MPNKFYEPGDQHAARVTDLFGQVAPRYDLINDLQSFGLHRSWKKMLLRLGAPQPGERVLDLCCGTGDIALACAARGAEVFGLDFSAPMLAVARRRSRKMTGPIGTRPVTWLQADAENLPLADDSFDVVTVGYGLRNLSSWERGLDGMFRIARPGGRLLVLDFGKPENGLYRGIYLFYLKFFVPLFGRFLCGDSQTHAYILESLKNYPAQKGVAEKMRTLGLEHIRTLNLVGGMMSINFGRKPTV
jgi:demethylmenaquinone methyltransferase/2-methoxy-6-polyprenyl-1,4-benzoquinol methylase